MTNNHLNITIGLFFAIAVILFFVSPSLVCYSFLCLTAVGLLIDINKQDKDQSWWSFPLFGFSCLFCCMWIVMELSRKTTEVPPSWIGLVGSIIFLILTLGTAAFRISHSKSLVQSIYPPEARISLAEKLNGIWGSMSVILIILMALWIGISFFVDPKGTIIAILGIIGSIILLGILFGGGGGNSGSSGSGGWNIIVFIFEKK